MQSGRSSPIVRARGGQPRRRRSRHLPRRLAAIGITYSQLVGEVRSGTALRLVDDSGLTLAEISRILGYSDPAHFTRAFTRWTGMTPRDYRRRGTQEPPANGISGRDSPSALYARDSK
jgi:AraC-like DNA-binding protein